MFITMTKTKIIVICGILVLSVIIGLLIKISLREPRSKSDQASAPIKSMVESNKLSSFPYETNGLTLRFPSAVKEFEELNIPILPITKPDTKAISKEKSPPKNTTESFFNNINKTLQVTEKSLTPNSASAQNIPTATSSEIILSLTKDQFHFLYPDKFIAGLVNVQNLFIKEFDSSYEPMLKIENDSQVRLVEEKIVATLLSANMITKDRAEQLVTTIRFTLPQLQLIDLEKYNSYGFYEFLPPRATPKGLFLAGFMKALADALAHKAQAVCGSCESRPECFQEGADTPGVAGSEVVTPFCYCTGCLTALGCLSLFSGEAAIYDQKTGICGAGVFAD